MKTRLTAIAILSPVVAYGVWKLRRRGDNADWLRNDQGVGPAHYAGTARGEKRAFDNNAAAVRRATG